MLYFRIRVKGDPSYMGNESNPERPYRVIQDTARILQEIDKWFLTYRAKYAAASFPPRISAKRRTPGGPSGASFTKGIAAPLSHQATPPAHGVCYGFLKIHKGGRLCPA